MFIAALFKINENGKQFKYSTGKGITVVHLYNEILFSNIKKNKL